MENVEYGGVYPAWMSLTFFYRRLQSHLPFGKTRCERYISTAKCFPLGKLCRREDLHLLCLRWRFHSCRLPFCGVTRQLLRINGGYSVPRRSDVVHNVIPMRDSQPCVEHCSESHTNKLTWLALIGIYRLHRFKCSSSLSTDRAIIMVNWNKRRENTNVRRKSLCQVCDF